MSASIRVTVYRKEFKESWDEFVGKSKNGTFLFCRDYMEYHAERFTDHSLVFQKGDRTVAVMPGNEAGDAVISHGGLTYGGLVIGRETRVLDVLEIFDAVRSHLEALNYSRLTYKPVPYIYHRWPSDEDLYALSVNRAQLIRRELASVVEIGNSPGISKGRKWGLSRARSRGLVASESNDYALFMALEEEILRDKYGAAPTHTADELASLARRFPDNIRLFTAELDGRTLGGVVVYVSHRVVHTQYIATTKDGREFGALDCIIDWLLNEVFRGQRYFDFGTSTGQAGQGLNEGVAQNKESYGGRAVVYDQYEMLL